MEKNFLEFIKELSPQAYEHAKAMEQLVFQDYGSSMAKSRNFLESIIAEIFVLENLNEAAQQYKTLYDRISFISKDGYFTNNEIQYTLHELRRIGNLGAHAGESEESPDLEKALKAHRLMYKVAEYFYETYSKDIEPIPAYEYPKPTDLKTEVMNIIAKLYGGQLPNNNAKVENDIGNAQQVQATDSPITLDLSDGESYLLRELKRLQDSSKEAIENANEFSSFKEYLHVDRKVQRDLVDLFEHKKGSSNSNLILLCGSVGDGKSHLLAYLKSKYPSLIEGYKIINDATESYSPSMNALETLKNSLREHSDNLYKDSSSKTILAVNMGILHNFIQNDVGHEFVELRKFIEESGLFSPQVTQFNSSPHFDLVCIGDYHPYELIGAGVQSEFYSGLTEKIFGTNDSNPFYRAYQEDLKNNIYTATHFNYEFMMENQVNETIIQILLESIIKFKLVISARAFLNFVVDILIVEDNSQYHLLDEFSKLNYSLPNILFNRSERSDILKHISLLNPTLLTRSNEIDQLVIDLYSINNKENILVKYIKSEKGLELLKSLAKANADEKNEMENAPFLKFAETVVLTAYITNNEFYNLVCDGLYKTYILRLYGYNTMSKDVIRDIYNEVKESIFKWKGSPRTDYVYISNEQAKFRLAQKLQFKPSMSHIKKESGAILSSFTNKFVVSYILGETNRTAELELDYTLFRLIQLMISGYVPNKYDYEEAIKYVEFVEKIMKFGGKNSELLVDVSDENKKFMITKDEFYGFVFQKEQ